MGQGDSVRDFAPSESMENAGILCVFPIFHTARLGQKIRRSPQLPLCGVALETAYCRIFQGAFRLALPVLPYREPEIIHSCDGLIPVMEKEQIRCPLIVTDAGIVANGLVTPLTEGNDEQPRLNDGKCSIDGGFGMAHGPLPTVSIHILPFNEPAKFQFADCRNMDKPILFNRTPWNCFQGVLGYSGLPIRILASAELPSNTTVFSVPFRLFFSASSARVNS